MSIELAPESAGEAAAVAELPLSMLLKEQTRVVHEALDQRLMALAPFSSEERYRCFLRMQARLQYVTSPLFHAPFFMSWFDDLAERDRWAAVLRDCADMGVPAEHCEADRRAAQAQVLDMNLAGLGWLYTVEGSNLGAAFLLKFAKESLGLSETFGARHLAGHAEGRGLAWRRFKEQLDGIRLSEAERAEAVQGALAAFAYVNQAVEDVFAPVLQGG